MTLKNYRDFEKKLDCHLVENGINTESLIQNKEIKLIEKVNEVIKPKSNNSANKIDFSKKYIPKKL